MTGVQTCALPILLSIALVIACGIGGFIGSLSTYSSLVWSRGHYYDTARFAHVFATAKRAPASLAQKIHAIPACPRSKRAWCATRSFRFPAWCRR